MSTLFITPEMHKLLKLAMDLMKEHTEVDRRVLEMYEGSSFLCVLKYHDIMAEEWLVLNNFRDKNKVLRTLKPQLVMGELAGQKELGLAGYLEVYIATLQHAVETRVLVGHKNRRSRHPRWLERVSTKGEPPFGDLLPVIAARLNGRNHNSDVLNTGTKGRVAREVSGAPGASVF